MFNDVTLPRPKGAGTDVFVQKEGKNNSMEKLTKIKVKDLLSHEDTTATIAPCVTVFTGRI